MCTAVYRLEEVRDRRKVARNPPHAGVCAGELYVWSRDARLLHCVLASDYEIRDKHARNTPGAARATL